MSEFVPAHGSWMGSWCWERVAHLLRQAGHDVTAIDLPGHGTDTTPVGEITLHADTGADIHSLDSGRRPFLPSLAS